MTCLLRRVSLVALLALTGVQGTLLNADLPRGTKDSIQSKLRHSEGSRGDLGCIVVDLDTGATLLEHNADAALIPASNMKLLTTIAALHKLGGDFEFITRIAADGDIEDGVLRGDLWLLGGGDPNISGRFHDNDPTALFKDWAAQIRKAGITSVEGDLRFDSTLFGREDYHEGWPRDDQYVKWYCAPVSALAFNDNCVGIRVTPTRAGQPAKIEVIPETAYVTVVNETTTKPGRKGAEIGIVRPRGSNTITVKGAVYEKATWGYFTDVTVDDPARFTATVFHEVLAREGVKVTGKPVAAMMEADRLEGCDMLVTHRAPLLEALPPINTNSQNLHAEMLFRLLGFRYAGKGTFKTGAAAVKAFLKDEQLWDDDLCIEDGSGLARGNSVSPRLIVKLLKMMEDHENFEDFKDSLAVAGESGTLERRLRESDVKGKVFAKTGYIRGVRALSGYLVTNERRLAFSILMNSCKRTKATQDDVVRLLARAGA